MRNSKRISVLAGGTAALIGVGVAFAAWTSTGTSTDGSATATSAQAPRVSVEDISGLYPTGTFDIDVTVTNPNPYNLALNSINFVSAATAKAGCTAANLTGSSNSSYTDVLAQNQSVTKTLTVTLSNNAEQACETANFDVVFSATGSSTAAASTVVVPTP